MSAFFDADQTDINWDTAESVKEHGYGVIDRFEPSGRSDQVSVDMGSLKQASSVVVAVLSAWHRHASLQDKSIVFVNLSRELRNIIALSGLDGVLMLESE